MNSITKFCTCFGYSESSFQTKQIPNETALIEFGMNVPGFRKILIKNDMEEYELPLIKYWYFLNLNIMKRKSRKPQIEEQLKSTADQLKNEMDLNEALFFLLSNNTKKDTSIILQQSTTSHTIKNNDIVDALTTSLVELYISAGFNHDKLTYEEAEEEIYEDCDREWVRDWIIENNTMMSFSEDYFDCNSIEEYVCERMIEQYASIHTTCRDVDLQFVSNRLAVLKNRTKKKPGAKPKNIEAGIIGVNLSYLKRIDKLINNTGGFTDIEQIKLTNKDYRFIHDCLVFFGMIDDYSKNEINFTTPEKYMNTILRQHKESSIYYKDSVAYTTNKIASLATSLSVKDKSNS